MQLLSLFRPVNLVIIALIQLIVQYNVIRPEMDGIATLWTHWQFAIVVIVTIILGATGYIINDLYDTQIDALNKPGENVIGLAITRKNAYWLYAMLLMVGAVLTFALGSPYKWPGIVIYLISAGALYWYSRVFKKILFLGNVLVGFYCGFVVYVLWLGQSTEFGQAAWSTQAHIIVLMYSGFAFLATVVREIVKDIEDLSGDVAFGARTLPAVAGLRKSAKLSALVTVTLVLFIAFCLTQLVQSLSLVASGYMIVFVVVPLLTVIYQVLSARDKTDFSKTSRLLKGILFTGTFFLLFV